VSASKQPEVTPEDIARASRAFRDRAGAAWVRLQEQTDTQIDPLGRAAMAKLDVALGARVLDVGCGCGQTLLELADVVGPKGHVLGVDISEPMLARAAERVAGRDEISLVCADAQTHAFAPRAFDALYSRFGVMFFDDARLAFTNLRGALRSGGRLSFVCWQELARNPWAAAPLAAVMRLLPASAMPDMLKADRPGPFLFGDRARVRAILSDAGFTDVELAPVEQPLHVGGAMTLDEALAYCRQIGPAARAMVDAPEALRAALDEALAGALAPFVGPRGVWMDAAAFVVTARG
jgi:SAM-dependent methyltransferase